MPTSSEAEATVATACARCDHEFEVVIALLAPGARVQCPACGTFGDPFAAAAEESIVVEEADAGPPRSNPVAHLAACAGCKKGIEIVPERMVGKVPLCDQCRDAIERHLGRGSGKSTAPFQPPTHLLADARRSSRPPGRR